MVAVSPCPGAAISMLARCRERDGNLGAAPPHQHSLSCCCREEGHHQQLHSPSSHQTLPSVMKIEVNLFSFDNNLGPWFLGT